MRESIIPEGVRFVWEQAERRLEAQIRQADALDTKAGALVGLHALAAGLVASSASAATGTARLVAVGAIAGLFVSGWFAFRAFRAQSYSRAPAPVELWRFGEWNEEEIMYRFLSTRLQALEENGRKLEAKARSLALSLTILALIALGVGAAGVTELVG